MYYKLQIYHLNCCERMCIYVWNDHVQKTKMLVIPVYCLQQQCLWVKVISAECLNAFYCSKCTLCWFVIHLYGKQHELKWISSEINFQTLLNDLMDFHWYDGIPVVLYWQTYLTAIYAKTIGQKVLLYNDCLALVLPML